MKNKNLDLDLLFLHLWGEAKSLQTDTWKIYKVEIKTNILKFDFVFIKIYVLSQFLFEGGSNAI